MQGVLQLCALQEYTFCFCGVERDEAGLGDVRSSGQQIDDALNDAEKEQFQCMVGSLM